MKIRFFRALGFAALLCSCGKEVTKTEFNVTPDGGTVTLADGNVVLTFPANAVAAPVMITATSVAVPAGVLGVEGTLYEFAPAIEFGAPVQMSLKYPTEPSGVRPEELGIYKRLPAGSWSRLSTSAVNSSGKTVTATLLSFSTYGVLFEPVNSVEVTPSASTIAIGGTVQLSAVPKSADGFSLPDRPVTWSSSDQQVASINASGLVTGAANGQVTITATSSGKSGNATVAVNPAAASPYFEDGFEDATLGATISGRGSNGFTWAAFQGKAGSSSIVSADRGHSGSRSLKVTYNAAAADGDSWAEQTFNLGENLPEVWVEWWLFFPSDFAWRHTEAPNNNKLMYLWADLYSSPSHTIAGIEYTSANSPIAQSHVTLTNRPPPGTAVNADDLAVVGSVVFTSAASMAGAWHKIRVHAKVGDFNANVHGVYQVWIDDKLIVQSKPETWLYTANTSATNPPRNYWRNGYLLGWANSGFLAATSFYVDDVKVYKADPKWP
jgi:hypothetical protein